MAKDLYESRQMYQGPWLFYIMIPIGMIILFLIFDFGYKVYNEYKLSKDTKNILYKMMESEELNTKEDYKLYAKEEYKKLGYETSDVAVIMESDYIILINYHSYFSMINEIFGGKKEIAVARYKGYYNEYKETVVEEYKEESLDEEETEDLDDGIYVVE